MEGQAFLRLYDTTPRPHPSPNKLDRRNMGRLRKRDNLPTGEGGRRDGREVESYDRKKPWTSIKHSILSGFCQDRAPAS
jgi:hypothetical protein